MLIREVILENFMSYEYARVPLKDGVNVVSGPNGSGKSSFLVGICVALGDTYTERSKKLSDLIRWGQDKARISLLLDNSVRSSGRRPIQRFESDVIMLTRNLRKDGKYWFEINQKSATKSEVIDILKELGFDPNNMLIIMHQNMPSQFASLSSQEKLKILETAVGFETYRANILEARRKLNSILSEEESIKDLLDRARETLGYWREQNERLQDKKRHQKRNSFLQQELAWSKVSFFEMTIDGLKQEISKANTDLKNAEYEIENNGRLVFDARTDINEKQKKWLDLIDERIEVEKNIGVCEHFLKDSENNIQKLKEIIDSSKINQKKIEAITETLKTKLKVGPTTLDDYFEIIDEIEANQSKSFNYLQSNLIEQVSGISDSEESYLKELNDANSNLKLILSSVDQIQEKINNVNEKYIEARIRMAILKDSRERIIRLVKKLEVDLEKLRDELSEAKVEAILKGARVDTGRSQDEILGEIRKTTGILLALSDVSENAQIRYEMYSRTYNDLQEKINLVRESRRKVLKEIEERTRKWLEVMKGLLEQVNNRYKILLSELQAQGEVRLINTNDIDESGLEIWVGFKGAKASQLDPYTHSGGERSTSIMAFLLSLQQNIKSPFRAVDEFDLHMDPKNREVVSNFIFEALKGSRNQYVTITPGQMAFRDREIHIITVNKTEGATTVSLVE